MRLAARLGGAEAFVEKLPQGYDTFIYKPAVTTGYGPLSGTKTRSGKPFDMDLVREGAGLGNFRRGWIQLSGGQMQRLAVYVPGPLNPRCDDAD